MQNRPISVTIIAWLSIVGAAFSLWNLQLLNTPAVRALLDKSALPFGVHVTMNVVGAIIALVCGVGLLKRKDWGRTVLIGWSVFGLLVAVFTSPLKSMIPIQAIFVAVVAFFLFRRPANAYFGKSYFGGASDDPANS